MMDNGEHRAVWSIFYHPPGSLARRPPSQVARVAYTPHGSEPRPSIGRLRPTPTAFGFVRADFRAANDWTPARTVPGGMGSIGSKSHSL